MSGGEDHVRRNENACAGGPVWHLDHDDRGIHPAIGNAAID
jgi:hypothetical protein